MNGAKGIRGVQGALTIVHEGFRTENGGGAPAAGSEERHWLRQVTAAPTPPPPPPPPKRTNVVAEPMNIGSTNTAVAELLLDQRWAGCGVLFVLVGL